MIHESWEFPCSNSLHFFQTKSTAKGTKSSRGKSELADKDLAAIKLEQAIVLSSPPSHPSNLLARPPAMNFSCAICSMQFVRKDSWDSHMRQHESEADTVSVLPAHWHSIAGKAASISGKGNPAKLLVLGSVNDTFRYIWNHAHTHFHETVFHILNRIRGSRLPWMNNFRERSFPTLVKWA